MMSQHCLKNCMYQLRFGTHNDQGIHGACPMDMLHALLLGIFRYVRDCFFEQIGKDSKLADDINGYATEFGQLISRQSDRNFPSTRFSNGVRRGKLNAKEFPGILLCLAAALRCTAVRKMLRKRRNTFGQEGVIADWQLLLETLLQWEQWLKNDRLRVKHVKRSQQKHRYIMYLIKKVGKRVTGMGLKITKFHTIMHYADDILNFGVPMEFDTGSNESGHKEEKSAAKLTQKKKELFDIQTCRRLEEKHLLNMAMQEINGYKLWNYYLPKIEEDEYEKFIEPPRHGGMPYYVHYNAQLNKNYAVLLTRKKGNQVANVEQTLVDFVAGLQDALKDYIYPLKVYTNHYREGYVFRSNTYFLKHTWRDWVVIDWGEEGHLPSHIMGFVNLSSLPEITNVTYGGMDDIEPCLGAIVEAAYYDEDDNSSAMSELFVPITKEIGGYTGEHISHRKYYLVDVETFVKPTAVIPDLGGRPNGYLQIKGRSQWKKIFEKWLESDFEVAEDYSSEEDNSTAGLQENYDENVSSDDSSDGGNSL